MAEIRLTPGENAVIEHDGYNVVIRRDREKDIEQTWSYPMSRTEDGKLAKLVSYAGKLVTVVGY